MHVTKSSILPLQVNIIITHTQNNITRHHTA